MFPMIPAIIAHSGGEESIRSVSREVMPELIEVDLLLPIKDSLQQEGASAPTRILPALRDRGPISPSAFEAALNHREPGAPSFAG